MTIRNRQHVYNDLRHRIETMQLAPGYALDEKKISEEFGISRTPLRDILRQLAGDGFVEIVGNRGASVAQMNHKTTRDFYQSAQGIYSMIARLAVQNAEHASIDALKQEEAIFKRAASDRNIELLVQADGRFHAIIGEMADNQFLMPSFNRLRIDHNRLVYTYYTRHNVDDSNQLGLALQHHAQMVHAIENNDVELIVDVTRAHWNLTRQAADSLLQAEPLPVDVERPAATS